MCNNLITTNTEFRLSILSGLLQQFSPCDLLETDILSFKWILPVHRTMLSPYTGSTWRQYQHGPLHVGIHPHNYSVSEHMDHNMKMWTSNLTLTPWHWTTTIIAWGDTKKTEVLKLLTRICQIWHVLAQPSAECFDIQSCLLEDKGNFVYQNTPSSFH